MSRRRSDDPPLEDFTSQRSGLGRLNGHTKWVVGLVGTLLVAGFMYLVKSDREEVLRQIRSNTDARISMQASIAVIQSQNASIISRLEKIDVKLDRRD